jgi:hypothetical protein
VLEHSAVGLDAVRLEAAFLEAVDAHREESVVLDEMAVEA